MKVRGEPARSPVSRAAATTPPVSRVQGRDVRGDREAIRRILAAPKLPPDVLARRKKDNDRMQELGVAISDGIEAIARGMGDVFRPKLSTESLLPRIQDPRPPFLNPMQRGGKSRNAGIRPPPTSAVSRSSL